MSLTRLDLILKMFKGQGLDVKVNVNYPNFYCEIHSPQLGQTHVIECKTMGTFYDEVLKFFNKFSTFDADIHRKLWSDS